MEDYDYEDNIDEEFDDPVWSRYAKGPESLNLLRACIPCLLVKTFAQFREEGCENCEKAFDMKDDDNKIADCTTSSFEGMLALTDPSKSWVARWQFLNVKGGIQSVPGVYAIKVKGEVSDKSEKELEEAGIPRTARRGIPRTARRGIPRPARR
jgi:transcription elongation factor SPT4